MGFVGKDRYAVSVPEHLQEEARGYNNIGPKLKDKAYPFFRSFLSVNHKPELLLWWVKSHWEFIVQQRQIDMIDNAILHGQKTIIIPNHQSVADTAFGVATLLGHVKKRVDPVLKSRSSGPSSAKWVHPIATSVTTGAQANSDRVETQTEALRRKGIELVSFVTPGDLRKGIPEELKAQNRVKSLNILRNVGNYTGIVSFIEGTLQSVRNLHSGEDTPGIQPVSDEQMLHIMFMKKAIKEAEKLDEPGYQSDVLLVPVANCRTYHFTDPNTGKPNPWIYVPDKSVYAVSKVCEPIYLSEILQTNDLTQESLMKGDAHTIDTINTTVMNRIAVELPPELQGFYGDWSP